MQINNQVKESYEALPYVSQSFKYCHPHKLEAIAKLLMLDPPNAFKSKILEIGCSFGGNLIPFALNNEEASLIGVDISATQVSKGNQIISEMGIKNLKLIQKDISDMGDELGKFDYIIAHGIYSWVPQEVRDAILRVIRNSLNPNGLAYISYNTYPGWKNKSILRDFIDIFVPKDKFTPQEQIKILRENLSFLKEYINAVGLSDKQKNIISIIDSLDANDDSYIYHEYFEIFNEPCLLYEFVRHLDLYDLGYLTDSNLFFSLNDIKREQIFSMVSKLGGDMEPRIAAEQYVDFATNMTFRRSIVTHKENLSKAKLDKTFSKKVLNELNLLGSFKIKDDKIFDSKNREINQRTSKIIEILNSSFPSSISVKEVVDRFANENDNIVYADIVGLILNDSIDILPNPVICVKYNPGKSKLKESYKKYIEYFINNDERIISFANYLNEIIGKFDKEEFKIMLAFDGQNSVKDIKRLLKEKDIRMQRKNEKGELENIDKNEAVEIYVTGLIEKMTRNNMFELI